MYKESEDGVQCKEIQLKTIFRILEMEIQRTCRLDVKKRITARVRDDHYVKFQVSDSEMNTKMVKPFVSGHVCSF